MSDNAVRDKIVETAGRLFYQQGYNLTGINQVIEEANIAKRSLYHHFESKTDLLLAYLDDFQEDWYRMLEEFLKPVQDPRERVLALFDFRIGNQQRTNFGGCPYIKISDEVGKVEERVAKRVQESKDTLRKYIRSLVKQSGHKQLLTDEALSEMIYLLMEGGVVNAAIYKDARDLKNARKIIRQLL
jgi:AcrR family transcriptional regulator